MAFSFDTFCKENYIDKKSKKALSGAGFNLKASILLMDQDDIEELEITAGQRKLISNAVKQLKIINGITEEPNTKKRKYDNSGASSDVSAKCEILEPCGDDEIFAKVPRRLAYNNNTRTHGKIDLTFRELRHVIKVHNMNIWAVLSFLRTDHHKRFELLEDFKTRGLDLKRNGKYTGNPFAMFTREEAVEVAHSFAAEMSLVPCDELQESLLQRLEEDLGNSDLPVGLRAVSGTCSMLLDAISDGMFEDFDDKTNGFGTEIMKSVINLINNVASTQN